MFTESFKGVSRKFQGCFKDILTMSQGSNRGISRVLQVRLKRVSRSFKGVSRVFKRLKTCVREVFMVFQEHFKEVSERVSKKFQ